jgi:DNA-binding MarR family transcriptional regulator
MTAVKRKKFPGAAKAGAPGDSSEAAARVPGAGQGEQADVLAGAAAAESRPAAPPVVELADQVHSAAIHLLRRLRVRDRESGIGPAQLSALSVLVFGGPRSLGELADAEQVRAPTMSRIVAGLQRAGLVRRHATEDGRRIRLEATAKGVSLLWEGRKRRVETLAEALGTLPESEQELLRQATALVQQILREL